MPVGIFKSVREVSSEDPVHVAANLLKENVGMKWKTESVGEKKAHVVLEFEQPQQIVGIDIGNEHAAFIAVLVSKSGCQLDDFKEFLLSCSFMTPVESKKSENVNRVRCFNGETLNSSLMMHKWKLVKIVCTQPFNKHVQYGLSFIKAHVNAPAVSKPLPDTKLTQAIKASLYPLKLREESPDSEADGNGASKLFQRWKQNRSEGGMEKISTAAAIRDAALPASKERPCDSRPVAKLIPNKKEPAPSCYQKESTSSCYPATTSEASATSTTSTSLSSSNTSSSVQILDRNRDELVFGDDNPEDDASDSDADVKKELLKKRLAADKQRRTRELEMRQKELEAKKNSKAKGTSLLPNKTKESPRVNTSEVEQEIPTTSLASQKRRSNSASKPESTPKKPKHEVVKQSPLKVVRYAPVDQLLNGVVLVISGIQNPDRAELRAMAIELGAQYRPTWSADCTHLICAVRNTPKYKEVKATGKGKVVSRMWLEKCYDLKKYLPWRRFALDPHDQKCPESDEEIMEDRRAPNPNDDIPSCSKNVQQGVKDKETQQLVVDHLSDPDTEDELERVAQMKQPQDKATSTTTICNDENNGNNSNRNEKSNGASMDIYEVDTEEEDYLPKMKE